MRFLAISGSARRDSTNTALLRGLAKVAPPGIEISVYDQIGALPVFSPDLEGESTPDVVRAFKREIAASGGLIISCPEYVRSIPGGLKNAIDWLVSGDELIAKPVALAHASHRGEDMLATLRLVLATVTSNFNPDIFLRLSLMKETPESIEAIVTANHEAAEEFLKRFAAFCGSVNDGQAAMHIG